MPNEGTAELWVGAAALQGPRIDVVCMIVDGCNQGVHRLPQDTIDECGTGNLVGVFELRRSQVGFDTKGDLDSKDDSKYL